MITRRSFTGIFLLSALASVLPTAVKSEEEKQMDDMEFWFKLLLQDHGTEIRVTTTLPMVFYYVTVSGKSDNVHTTYLIHTRRRNGESREQLDAMKHRDKEVKEAYDHFVRSGTYGHALRLVNGHY